MSSWMPRGTLRWPFECRPDVVTEVTPGSIFTHVVNWSVPEETTSSLPDRISSLGNGSSRRSGERTELLRLNKIEAMGASVFSQKDAVPWVQVAPR